MGMATTFDYTLTPALSAHLRARVLAPYDSLRRFCAAHPEIPLSTLSHWTGLQKPVRVRRDEVWDALGRALGFPNGDALFTALERDEDRVAESHPQRPGKRGRGSYTYTCPRCGHAEDGFLLT